MGSIRTALVGFGYAGQTFHAPLIAATAGLELAAIVSGNPAKVAPYWPRVPVRAQIGEVLADPTIDLVVIATPNSLHAEQASLALAAGKHVVVDKPFTVALADAQALERQAGASGRVLSIFHNRRWDADFLALSALIRQGALGRVTQFESHFDRFRSERRDRWRERADVAGAGLWYDLGSHLLDQALFLFGLPLSIFVDIATQRAGDGAADYFHALMRYPDGLRIILHGSMLIPDSGLRFAVHGDGGSFIKHGLDRQEDQLKAGLPPGCDDWGVDPLPACLTRPAPDGLRSGPHAGPAGDYRRYYAGVRDAITGDGPNPVTAAEAIQVMQLLALGIESAGQRREIDLSEPV
ncbi:oxidoreductase [Niveispirillum fermenti]|uniref:oxidoreductase n=1 Tax=Niveispirillum fermenti TaxID=1233113 RepID=UPI003A856787